MNKFISTSRSQIEGWPLFDTMAEGEPLCWMRHLINASSTPSIIISFIALKMQLLDSRSLITITNVAPDIDTCRFVMKPRIGSGFRRPCLSSLYVALLPQISQFGRNSRISCDGPGQVDRPLMIALKRSRPGWSVRAKS